MRVKAVAFDLGGTLVRYYERAEFPSILARALEGVHPLVAHAATVSLAQAQSGALAENRERPDGKVCPLQERLNRIFGIHQQLPADLQASVAAAFLAPIFACARKYEDTDPVLCELRKAGYRLAIVSNTPWGSPSEPWRAVLARLGLAQAVDLSLFCVDVGWRKPALPIFRAALERLGVAPGECAFVGDHPGWDVDGSRAAGMVPVLIDRADQYPAQAGTRIGTLGELVAWLREARGAEPV